MKNRYIPFPTIAGKVEYLKERKINFCGKPKPRKQECPHCGFEEEAKEEVAYMSLY